MDAALSQPQDGALAVNELKDLLGTAGLDWTLHMEKKNQIRLLFRQNRADLGQGVKPTNSVALGLFSARSVQIHN